MLFAVIIGPTYDKAYAQILQANNLVEGMELRWDLMEPLTEVQKETLSQQATVPVIHNFGEALTRIGSDTLYSYHNLDETPQDLEGFFARIQEKQATIYKIATFANSTLDALRMLLFVKEKRAQGIRLCGICMGDKGQVSRILAPIFGCYLNYVALDEPCAPGQLRFSELTN
ncbi:MAG TPA: type I 3-dehydroquinate dehydratase, partial [Rhabdochlamydiaceae bacterium]|nr:type I 3-dehydroquinate dehydratase [Rhabdochlamydiaceae bacterium]